MPGMSGLEVAARLSEAPVAPRIVFITAYDQYAIEAFEHSAFDYLLKPASEERLAKTVAKLKLALRAVPSAPAPFDANMLAMLRQLGATLNTGAAPGAPLQWIRAAQGGETRLIPVEEVIYFQSKDKYTSVFTADGECLIRTPLRELITQLDAAKFWQIHRGTVVAARHIGGTKTDLRGRLMVRLKERPEQLVVSRNYLDLFKQM